VEGFLGYGLIFGVSKMSIGLVGLKCGMTRIFTDAGVSVPVTLIKVEKNSITQIKTAENDGYDALQVTMGKRRSSLVTKPMAGHYAKAGVESGLGLWEFILPEKESSTFSVGSELKVDIFTVGQKVDVRGVTKGKGFAGTIKRHHFHSQDATHGNSLSHRAAGSTGNNQSPGRVFPGKKMAGQLGNVQRTAQNQEVVRIDVEQGFIFVKGAVPGATNGYVVILPSVKRGK
jgi:large subunit ribosomal protein L3